MPEINRSQAMLLKKADIIPNESGSALGMHFYEKGTHIFVLPGVPEEMKSMVTNHIIPSYFVDTPTVNHITIKTAGVCKRYIYRYLKGYYTEGTAIVSSYCTHYARTQV